MPEPARPLNEYATKADLADLRVELMLADFKVEMHRGFAAFRITLILWIAGLLVAQGAALAALLAARRP